MVDAGDLAREAVARAREQRLIETAERNDNPPPPISVYAGFDCKTGEALLRPVGGGVVRGQPLYNTAVRPGDIMDLHVSQGLPKADSLSAWEPEPEPVVEEEREVFGKIKILFSLPDGSLWIGGDRANPKRVGVKAETPPEAVDRLGRKYEFSYFLVNLGDGDRFTVAGIAIPSIFQDPTPYLAVHFPQSNRRYEFQLDEPIPAGRIKWYSTWDGSGLVVMTRRPSINETGTTYNFLPGLTYGVSGTGGAESFVSYELYPTRVIERAGSRSGASFSQYWPLYPGADNIATESRAIDVQVSGQRSMWWSDESSTSTPSGWRLDSAPAAYWDIFGGEFGRAHAVGGFGYQVGVDGNTPEGKFTVLKIDLTSETAIEADQSQTVSRFDVPVYDLPENATNVPGLNYSYHP